MKPSSRKVIVHTPEPASGAARYVRELVGALHACAVPVTLLCPQNAELAGSTPFNGVTVRFSGYRSLDAEGSLADRVWRNVRYAVCACYRQLRLSQPGDIIHFQFPLHFPVGLLTFGGAYEEVLHRLHGA